MEHKMPKRKLTNLSLRCYIKLKFKNAKLHAISPFELLFCGDGARHRK
jgi:hypothetical protein